MYFKGFQREERSLKYLMWKSDFKLLEASIFKEGDFLHYYDYQKIISYNAPVNILIGERGVRKKLWY